MYVCIGCTREYEHSVTFWFTTHAPITGQKRLYATQKEGGQHHVLSKLEEQLPEKMHGSSMLAFPIVNTISLI